MITPKLDVYSILIFLGIVQGLFLASFFLFGKRQRSASDILLALQILSFCLSTTEVFLNHTGYIIYNLWLVDFAEPLNFTIAPLYFLFTYSFINHKFKGINYLHFLPFGLYLLYSCLYLFQGNAFKYNSFISAYHPSLPYLSYHYPFDDDPFFIRKFVNELTILHFITYFVLSLVTVGKALKKDGLRFFSKAPLKLSFIRFLVLQFGVVVIAFILIKIIFKRDLGDYLLCSFAAINIYVIAFYAFRAIDAFNPQKQDKESKKYNKSPLSEEMKDEILSKLTQVMDVEKYFINNLLSLPDLARKINTTPHYLSQVLNERLNKSFFDFIALHRIKEAQQILSDKEHIAVKIEEIGEMVGYNSKSAFNTAFKKYTGKTPAEYRKM